MNASQNSFVIKTNGTLWAIGGVNYAGSLGINLSGPSIAAARSSPTQIPGTTWSNISSGAYNNHNQAIAQKSDGTLWVWGENENGILGLNQPNATNISSPTQIPGTTWDVSQMAMKKIIATKTDGTLWSWGYNNNGGAGVNSNVQNSSPTQVGTDTNWIASSFRGGRNATIIMRG